jgi:hypothetical protein
MSLGFVRYSMFVLLVRGSRHKAAKVQDLWSCAGISLLHTVRLDKRF